MKMKLSEKHPLYRDYKIEFNEAEHSYTIDGKVPQSSVSKVAGSVFQPFVGARECRGLVTGLLNRHAQWVRYCRLTPYFQEREPRELSERQKTIKESTNRQVIFRANKVEEETKQKFELVGVEFNPKVVSSFLHHAIEQQFTTLRYFTEGNYERQEEDTKKMAEKEETYDELITFLMDFNIYLLSGVDVVVDAEEDEQFKIPPYTDYSSINHLEATLKQEEIDKKRPEVYVDRLGELLERPDSLLNSITTQAILERFITKENGVDMVEYYFLGVEPPGHFPKELIQSLGNESYLISEPVSSFSSGLLDIAATYNTQLTIARLPTLAHLFDYGNGDVKLNTKAEILDYQKEIETKYAPKKTEEVAGKTTKKKPEKPPYQCEVNLRSAVYFFWKFQGILGTLMHKQIENWANIPGGGPIPSNEEDASYMIRAAIKYFLEENAYLQQTELMVGGPVRANYLLTGTIDAVYKYNSSNNYIIVDWKRAKDIRIDYTSKDAEIFYRPNADKSGFDFCYGGADGWTGFGRSKLDQYLLQVGAYAYLKEQFVKTPKTQSNPAGGRPKVSKVMLFVLSPRRLKSNRVNYFMWPGPNENMETLHEKVQAVIYYNYAKLYYPSKIPTKKAKIPKQLKIKESLEGFENNLKEEELRSAVKKAKREIKPPATPAPGWFV